MENVLGKFDEFCKKYQQACKLLTGSTRSEDSYLLETVQKYIRAVLSRAKFKVGDNVIVAGKIDFEKAWGWLGSRHTLTQIATVREIEYREDYFLYTVMFDREFWTDEKGKAHPIDDNDHKHVFSMLERDLSICPNGFVADDPIGFNDPGASI